MVGEGRQQALDTTLAQIRKRFGEGAIMRMGSAPRQDVEAISTGSLQLDLALGIGGIPKGRVMEIYGPEASGKTTLCQHIIAECQKAGGIAAFIDAEHALDPSYAERCGVNIDDLYLSQPDTGEQALEIAEALIRSGAVDVIVIDSVAALVPEAEIEGDMGDAHMALQARLMSQALRKIAGAVRKSNTAIIFTNQIRTKIGVFFGNPETTPGGLALKFYAAVRLDMRRMEAIKDGSEIIGNRVRVRVKKNKVAPPFRSAEFDIMFDHGISREGSVLDAGVDMGIIDKRGSYYYYGEERLAQGRENAKDYLTENPDLLDTIERHIRQEAGLIPKDEEDEAQAEAVEADEDAADGEAAEED
ncbi:MAG: recombinase RecA [Chloroflexota bacterium]|nr:recombinase RecA [Chloroflexota bacterium]